MLCTMSDRGCPLAEWKSRDYYLETVNRIIVFLGFGVCERTEMHVETKFQWTQNS